jgi:hypothetical protein
MGLNASLAQSVEQWIENPRVPSSILGGGTIFFLTAYGDYHYDGIAFNNR